jgi:hypothetical protein
LEKLLLPLLRDRRDVATHVRSTLLLSSIQSLRAQGLGPRYEALLARAAHDAVLGCVAGVWLPMQLGLAHYEACEAMRLTPEQQEAQGRQVGERLHGAMLGVVARAARGAGVTPWSLLGRMDLLWERVIQGGAGPSLVQLGPKEARVELVGLPLLDVPYVRRAYRGLFQVALQTLCSKVYVTDVRVAGVHVAAYRVSWA